jgi:hypothetical protein
MLQRIIAACPICSQPRKGPFVPEKPDRGLFVAWGARPAALVRAARTWDRAAAKRCVLIVADEMGANTMDGTGLSGRRVVLARTRDMDMSALER